MMRILVIGQSYGRGHAATSDLFTDLVEGLAAVGLQVEVLTSAADGAPASLSVSNGISIHRVSRQSSLWIRRVPAMGRWLSLVSLWLGLVSWCLLTRQRFSHVIVLDTPHLLTLAALVLRWRHQSAAIAWVMDRPLLQIHRLNRPGSLKSRLGAWLNSLQVALFRHCDAVGALGDCMVSTLQHEGVSPGKLVKIRTWDQDDLPQHSIAATEARKLAGLPQHFTVMYSGYAGAWHDFNPVIECVQNLAFDKRLQFLFVGEGPGIQAVQEWCAANPGANVIFRPFVAAQQRNNSLCCADLHLVCLKPSMLGTCSPSKLNPLLGLGRPVLVVAPPGSQIAVDVVKTGSGCCTPSGPELIAVIRDLLARPEALERMAGCASAAFLEHHCRSKAIGAWLRLIENLA